MSLRAPLLLLTLAALTSSAPAHAGRASACKAPPFAVPRETQRAVDAAIDARVVGTGAGSLATTVETRTDYETTTLSQDAAARAWFEHTLCLKLAKKLISQELHDELLRGLLEAPASSVQQEMDEGTSVSSEQGVTAPITADLLAGTWQLTATYRDGSCPPQLQGGAFAYTWLISTSPDGGVSVSVQGKTSYGELSGSIRDGVLFVGGSANLNGVPDPSQVVGTPEGQMIAVLPRTDIRLSLVNGGLVGSRELVTWTSELSADKMTFTVLPCVLHYDVRATR